MVRCYDDSCDQVHCGQCGSHTVGDSLLRGLCQVCADIEEDQYRLQNNMEGRDYRDFAPPNEDDPEAYDEMCREDRMFWTWRR
jgi:hypothetical protein